MILSETSSRKPSRIAFWTVLGLGALLLPLAPRVARTEATEEPKQAKDRTADPSNVDWKFENLHGREVFMAKHCLACHQPEPIHDRDLHGKPQSWQQAHNEVVRLLDEIKTRRAQLQETEDRLKRALDALKRLEPRAESAVTPKYQVTPYIELAPQTSWNITWAEALFDRRLIELPSVKQGTAGVSGIKFLMTNHGNRLVHIENIRTSSASLSARATQYELKPGETAAIEAKLDTKLFVGHKNFQIFVQFDKPDHQQVTLEVRANVGAAALANPESPERLQELEKKLDALRKEMENLRREMRPDKPH